MLKTFEERFEYLKVIGQVGDETFGSSRFFNQDFYRSQLWRSIRNQVIVRDNGCDLGIEDRPITGRMIIIHHMNPITIDDIMNMTPNLIDPEFLICVSPNTHQALHYGDEKILPKGPIERFPNDTCPWRK
jgi:hypothetical protein